MEFKLNQNNASIMAQYRSGENYKVVDLPNKGKLCYVFFSSHGLYFPNDEETFHETIEIKDRYEWENLSKMRPIAKHAKRLIFVRDVFKQWYIHGISERNGSVERVVKLLMELTAGYEVIMVGSSAGGYAAVLYGNLCHADRIIALSPQFLIMGENCQLDEEGKKWNMEEKYLDTRIVLGASPVYCVYPGRSEMDIWQTQQVEGEESVVRYAFQGSRHGETMVSVNMPYFIRLKPSSLGAIYKVFKGKYINNRIFLAVTLLFYMMDHFRG